MNFILQYTIFGFTNISLYRVFQQRFHFKLLAIFKLLIKQLTVETRRLLAQRIEIVQIQNGEHFTETVCKVRSALLLNDFFG